MEVEAQAKKINLDNRELLAITSAKLDLFETHHSRA